MKAIVLGSVGVIRYPEVIYKNAKGNRYGIELDQQKCGKIPMAGAPGGFVLSTSFKDYSKYDVVHNAAGYPFFPLRKGSGVLIASANEPQPILYPELGTVAIHSIKDRLWDISVVKTSLYSVLHSDYIIANSKLSKHGAIVAGFPSKKIFVVHHGIEKEFRVDRKPRKRGKKFIVGTLGTMSPHKNTFFLIDAFKKVPGDDIELRIWGKSTYSKAELDERIGGDKRIKLMGFAPFDKIVDIYDSFDVFCFPSIYEGFGIPIIEAKARRLPVILYEKGHISPELAKYCFKAKDEEHMAGIIEQLKRSGYNEKAQKKATADARSFTWEKATDETLKVYTKVV